MDGVIDPPSSAQLLTNGKLAQKARDEICFVASDTDRLVGCLFLVERTDHLYVGKLAVAKEMQGRGLGAALLNKAGQLAHTLGKSALELQTRVELTGNQAAFAKLGFREIARTAHAGFERPTSITMRKPL
jgi:GNAT superfamily N-acetyltransferase